MFPRFLPSGDSALTVEFGDRIDQALLASVATLDGGINREKDAGRLYGIIDTIPTYRSLTVIFDPGVLSWDTLRQLIIKLIDESELGQTGSASHWKLPVCYDDDYGIDLGHVASSLGLSTNEVVRLHSDQIYTVYMIGFLPGFPFMGDVAPALEIPRLIEPRTRVPAGSVAIAGQQTAIYPWESPGGWNILGRCPIPLFNAHRLQPALLSPGDRVSFETIDYDLYEELATKSLENSLDFEQFRIGSGK